MAYSIVPALGILAIAYVFLSTLHRLSQDTREPRSVENVIPFITPVLSMASWGNKFHRAMRDKYNLPIYTLRLPGTRFYVVNSPSLITAVQARSRTLSFPAIEAGIAASLFGVSKATSDILGHDLTGSGGYLMSFPKYIHPALGAGPGLDAMTRRSVQVISSSLDAWAEKGPTTVNLFEWVRHELLMATTEGVYGPKNPFRDPAMEKAWHTFEPGMMMFVLNLFPRVLARDSFRAREYMVRVWARYFAERSHERGSALVRARARINDDFGIPPAETARVEIGGSQAVLTNTLPAAFWVVYHIFSDPVVLRDVRAELARGVVHAQQEQQQTQTDADAASGSSSGSSGNHHSTSTSTIDMDHVRSSCPVLLSTLKETLRVHSVSVATRVAIEDVELVDGGGGGGGGGEKDRYRYLLRKGGTVMMPSAVQHTDRTAWGDNVGEFDHRRFVRGDRDTRDPHDPDPDTSTGGAKQQQQQQQQRRISPSVAFRGFGGGTTLCPGRHFATAEILMFAALLVLRFDVWPVAKKGDWAAPTTARASVVNALPTPDPDIEVELRPTGRAAGSRWDVTFSCCDRGMDIAAEDIETATPDLGH
ncbi:cytochrome P450 [Xylariaceae sp. FL0804]|nr:cytochrome P450 [Xylariaceae sp. FL0804]